MRRRRRRRKNRLKGPTTAGWLTTHEGSFSFLFSECFRLGSNLWNLSLSLSRFFLFQMITPYMVRLISSGWKTARALFILPFLPCQPSVCSPALDPYNPARYLEKKRHPSHKYKRRPCRLYNVNTEKRGELEESISFSLSFLRFKWSIHTTGSYIIVRAIILCTGRLLWCHELALHESPSTKQRPWQPGYQGNERSPKYKPNRNT